LNCGVYVDKSRELTSSFHQHEIYFQLVLNPGGYETKADYLLKLPTEVAVTSIVIYGSTLVDHLNEERRRDFVSHVVRLSLVGQPNDINCCPR
jgi:hypothetical protein